MQSGSGELPCDPFQGPSACQTASLVRVAVTLEQCWHRVPGGTATSILGLLGALRDRLELDLVGVAARHADSPPAPFVPPIPVTHLPLPRPLLYEGWHAPGALRWPPVERATGAVDVVHATAVAVPPTASPLVVTIHDLAFLAEPSLFTRHGLRFFRRGTELARRHATVVVVPSRATAAECVDAGFDQSRLRVVPWGVETANPAAAADIERARIAHGLPERYVLFCGTIEPRKNLRRLVDAFVLSAPPDVVLALAGGAGWHEDAAELLAPLGARARPLGFVASPERDLLYAGAAAVAYPSLREGFGLPVLEAMAQGAPVLTSRGTATEEVAGDAAVLVDPTDTGAIASALADLLADPAAAAALGERGRARAATFTWAATAEATHRAYEEAAGR